MPVAWAGADGGFSLPSAAAPHPLFRGRKPKTPTGAEETCESWKHPEERIGATLTEVHPTHDEPPGEPQQCVTRIPNKT